MKGIFSTKPLGEQPDVWAPDGSEVRQLLSLRGGSMAHFQLAPGRVSRAVAHRSVEEIWYFLAGRGEMWRKLGELQEVVAVHEGVCLTIPVGTCFQFRSDGTVPLKAVAITMPPWPGGEEAYFVPGVW